MSVSSVNTTGNHYSKTNDVKNKQNDDKGKNGKNDAAALAPPSDSYEKSSSKAVDTGVYKRDTATIAQLNKSQQAYIDNLRNMVGQLMNQVNKGSMAGGGNKFHGGLNINKVDSYWDLLVDNGDGTFSFDPRLSPEAQDALRAKAQEDISEDGYWGVKQTSQRILDYAKAITGGDPSKIGEMRKMAQAAFDDVARIMGGKLPQLSQDTYDAVMKGFDEWEASANASGQAATAATGQ